MLIKLLTVHVPAAPMVEAADMYGITSHKHMACVCMQHVNVCVRGVRGRGGGGLQNEGRVGGNGKGRGGVRRRRRATE